MTEHADTAAPPAPPAGPDGSAIHDIGYRPYDGERLGRRYIRRSLFVESARGAYGLGRSGRSKVMPMLLAAAACLPALAIVVATALTGAPELVGGYHAYAINLQLVIAIYVAGQAPVSVSRDLRFGTMSLYLSRPLEAIDYVVAKFAAMATAIALLVVTPLTILFVGALIVELPLGEQLPDFLRAVTGAVLLALVLAAIGLAIAATTPRRGIGVAAIITVLLVTTAVEGITQDLALEQGATTVATYLGLLSPFTLVDGVQTGLLGARSVLPTAPTDVGAGLVFAAVAVLLVVASAALLLRRYRKVSVS